MLMIDKWIFDSTFLRGDSPWHYSTRHLVYTASLNVSPTLDGGQVPLSEKTYPHTSWVTSEGICTFVRKHPLASSCRTLPRYPGACNL